MRLALAAVLMLAAAAFPAVVAPADPPYQITRHPLTKPMPRDEPRGYHDPQLSPDGRFLLYRTGIHTEAELWIARADGTGARRLARGATSAQWSPHAWRVAFTRRRSEVDDREDLYTIRSDGSDERLVARSVRFGTGGYAWSPTGTHIAYVTPDRQGDVLYLMDPDGTRKRRVLASRHRLTFTWRSDGRVLCTWDQWENWRDGYPRAYPPRHSRSQIGMRPECRGFLFDVASGKLTSVQAPSLRGYTYPGPIAFSPDNRHFTVVSYGIEDAGQALPLEARPISVWLKEISAARWQKLFTIQGIEATLHWSPRGHRLAVHVEDCAGECMEIGKFAIWRANGERISQFQEGFDLRWSPGGGRLAFCASTGGHAWDVLVCDNAGLRRTMIGEGGDCPWGMCWFPDGMSLAVVRDYGTAIDRVELRRE